MEPVHSYEMFTNNQTPRRHMLPWKLKSALKQVSTVHCILIFRCDLPRISDKCRMICTRYWSLLRSKLLALTFRLLFFLTPFEPSYKTYILSKIFITFHRSPFAGVYFIRGLESNLYTALNEVQHKRKKSTSHYSINSPPKAKISL